MELNEARTPGSSARHLRLIAVWVIFGFLAAALLHVGNERTYTATNQVGPRHAGRQRSLRLDPRSPTWPRPIATRARQRCEGALDDAHITTRDPVDPRPPPTSPVTALGSSAVLGPLRPATPNRRVAAVVLQRPCRSRYSDAGEGEQRSASRRFLTELDGRIATLNRRIGEPGHQDRLAQTHRRPRARDNGAKGAGLPCPSPRRLRSGGA